MINGQTVPDDYGNFVLGPVSATAGEFWRDALSYLIITGSLACAAALTNAGLRYMYAMGREGLLPRYLGKTHPTHKSPYMAVLTWGAVAVGAVPALPRHEPHRPRRLLLALAAGRDLDRARAGADRALGVHVLPARASDASSRGRRRCARGWASLGQIFVLALFFHFETYVAAGSALYVRELFTIGSGTFSVPVSWLGIIGVGVPLASLGYAWYVKRAEPGAVRDHGPLRQRVRLVPSACRGAAGERRPGDARCRL